MDNKLIKPYEISVWEDKLIPIEDSESAEYKFKETKLAVIGSNTMTGLNKVYNPVFNKKSNGEKTLSFSLKYKYFDPYSGNSDIINPFASMLTNERKVKLFYDNEWYEFVVKDHTESSDGLEWTYTCTDAFVLELSKNGYNITFDSELNNNQGTAVELATETLKNTDWQVGESDNLKQLVAEPIYQAVLNPVENLEIINVDTNEIATFNEDTDIYLFYSYVKNKSGQYVQFIIKKSSEQYTIDDKNVVTDTNYRIITDLTYQEDLNSKGFYLNDTPVISIDEIETSFQVNRLVYNQLTTYDTLTQRTVSRFAIENTDKEVYKYTDYSYATSNVILNYITNGENFNALEDGSLQGWNPYVEFSRGNKITPLELVSKPELKTGQPLADLDVLSQIEGFLKYTPNGPREINSEGKVCNMVCNSGIANNTAFIKSIAKGDEFVFRWRAGVRNSEESSEIRDVDCLVPYQNLRAIIAKYDQDTPGWGNYYKHVSEDDIIVEFNTTDTPLIKNNIIQGGYLAENNTQYVINGVVQEVSTKYVYEVVTTTDEPESVQSIEYYVWDIDDKCFVTLNSASNYLQYYYLVGEATTAVSNMDLTDPTQNFGIFIYTTDEAPAVYIQDIQLTRCVRDKNNEPILIGNIPTATSVATDYYYMKPVETATAQDIILYTSPEALLEDYGLSGTIVPLFNTNSEKYLTISVSKSNCFNILQTIAETFECWVDLSVVHDSRGYIEYDEDGRPQKYVYLRQYAGKDNYAGFKYGINLDTIERTVNSDEIVTKLLVDSSQSDYVDSGFISIAAAPSNQSGESYIINFDYYYNQNLLDRDNAEADRVKFIEEVANINGEIQIAETNRRNLEASLTLLGSNRNVYSELLVTAKDTKNEALGDFQRLTGQTYEDYRDTHTTLADDNQLTEEETIMDILGKIYTSSSVINNYFGLQYNTETEYWNVRKQLYGNENYSVTVWVEIDEHEQRHLCVELNDYLVGFQFIVNEQDVYTVDISTKYFDIDVNNLNSIIIDFIPPENYSMQFTTYEVNEAKTRTFKITADEYIEGLIAEINQLYEQKEQLVNDFNNKYSRYIQEGTWNSTDYIDSEQYYLDALQVSITSAQPIVSYTINVVEVSELEGLEQYNFDAGDKTYVEDTEFFGWSNKNGVLTPAREEVIVSEVEWHLDEPNQNVITVQNYKTQFEDLFQRISAAVQTVQYNEATYAKMSSLLDANGTLNQDVLLESLNRISGQQYSLTSDGSVMVDGDAILVQNLTNPANRVIINSEGIRVSSDGGQSWQTVINGQGINIGAIYTGTLNTNEVIIGNKDNPSFRWDKAGISAFRSYTEVEDGQDVKKYDLQTFVRYDEYGLYGIEKNSGFKAEDLNDVKDNAWFAVTWDGFFIRNKYPGGGKVEITSENDFRILNDPLNQGNLQEKIKIGALEWRDSQQNIYTNPATLPDAVREAGPSLYGIRIKGKTDNVDAFKADDQGNLEITGTINAEAGEFSGLVQVGTGDPYIKIDGENALIGTSDYSEGAGPGWMINADGDAVFNNITARGAIKTAVFEYAEIQAVGGVFIFRPSSTIKSAEIASNETDLILTVEKPMLFKIGQWCKVSNYYTGNYDPDTFDGNQNILQNNGLTNVYPISSIETHDNKTYITLEGAAAMVGVGAAVEQETDLIGGALVDMGNEDGTSNYGIGINSSDNTVNLPARAISLFETEVVPDSQEERRVRYNYRGILGTLPSMDSGVDTTIYNDMVGTQGIYTDNMYIGDDMQYMSFYTRAPYYELTKDEEIDENKTYYSYDPVTNEYNEVTDPVVEDISTYYEYITDDKNLVIKAKKIQYQATDGSYVSVDDPAPYIWFDGTGAHLAGGIDGVTFVSDNQETYGFNTWMSQDSAAFKYNNIDLTKININGFYLYGAPIEITSGGETSYIQNSEQISLTTNGLQINRPGTLNEDTVVVGTKAVEVNQNGLSIYNNSGVEVARYGDTILIGEINNNRLQSGIQISNTELGFYSEGQRTAYVNDQKLYIPYSVVLNEMIVGTRDYSITEDTEPKDKKYYIKNGDTYEEVVPAPAQGTNPHELGYYEKLETSLWAWKVTKDEHLRLVWNGGDIEGV